MVLSRLMQLSTDASYLFHGGVKHDLQNERNAILHQSMMGSRMVMHYGLGFDCLPSQLESRCHVAVKARSSLTGWQGPARTKATYTC